MFSFPLILILHTEPFKVERFMHKENLILINIPASRL